ncbi:MAG TPA: formylglycine-generating enzyme family protein [Gemmatimonadales bacterium]|nr:formylglycine-generating enzyme family protein [Gemmatimonadales bacterium]
MRWLGLIGLMMVGACLPHASRRAGEEFDDCAGAGWCPRMVRIPAGSFTMGAAPGESPDPFFREGPQHRVSVRGFALGKLDVTHGEWAAFVAATHRATPRGCAWTGRVPDGQVDSAGSWRDPGFAQDDRHPVVCVTWDDAQDYVRWLSARTGHRYRLPSEAEWEYAARAGSTTRYPWGDTASHAHANYGADSGFRPLAAGRDRWLHTSPAGAFPPNAFGLYDMNGNVLQYVQDCFAPSYAGLPTDGSAYETDTTLELTGELAVLNGERACSLRAARGGDWNDPPAEIRSAFRNFGPPPGQSLHDYRSTGVAFRVARDLD